ncbi:type VI secretion system-associated protein TagF [Noviherbaspirillum sp.]|uniref:type VI secretion system-associated protein TagF n=1 Tax=Noviherbaspirillum sp. TaxID=1926288 RepID=UPI002FE0D194
MPFKRAETGHAATYTLYGKLRNRADFVRVNADHAAVTEFDDLIQRTFARLSTEPGWEEAYDNSAPVEFQYVSRDTRHTFLGILTPSSDQAGRRYPLVAGAILPSDSIAGYAHVSPIAYEVFFDGLREQVSSAVDNSVEALSCRQFLETQLRGSDTSAADLELAKSVVRRFMHITPSARLGELLAAPASATTLNLALLNLAFYRAFLRRFDSPATHQMILLPLPEDKGERALVASAWLSMLDALWAGGRIGQPWSGDYIVMQRPAGEVALAACFGKVHDRFTPAMLGGLLDASVVLDLGSEQDAWINHPLYAEVSYALGRLLADPASSLESLCAFLQDVGKKLEEKV